MYASRREGRARLEKQTGTKIGWFAGLELARIGLEAGPLSQWLYRELREAGLKVELLETRHVRTAFKAMPVKTDRKYARGIAQLMRLGWFWPVQCKSLPAQETRVVLTARRLLQAARQPRIVAGASPADRAGRRHRGQELPVLRRQELGLSQEQAARAIGVNIWTILLWEQGRCAPPPSPTHELVEGEAARGATFSATGCEPNEAIL